MLLTSHAGRPAALTMLLLASVAFGDGPTVQQPVLMTTSALAGPTIDARTAAWSTALSVPTPRAIQEPLKIPSDLPGSEAPRITLPPFAPNASDPARRAAIQQLYGELPPIPVPFQLQVGPSGGPLSLDELQQEARMRSPVIRQAAAGVESAQGNAIQAGAYPNPHLGYQADDINTGGTAGYQGMNVSQTISTGGKLQLARAAACVDVQNAELTLRRADYDLGSRIRSAYFAVLVARQKIRVNRALAEFADNVYRVQIERVRGGEAAAYEPLQLRVLALQARAQVVQACNEDAAAWKRLAATIGQPDLAPMQLAGDAEQPQPRFTYDAAMNQILHCHSNLIIAQNGVTKSRYLLRLAEITPWIPNLDTEATVQKDNTTEPFGAAVSVKLGATVPLFDRNVGAIRAAQGDLARARQEYDRVRNELVASLADAFARYQTNSVLADYYRLSILVDQVRVYRGIYDRYQQDPDAVSFNDIVTAQQTLATAIATYMQALSDQWQASAELTGLLQVRDLCEVSEVPLGEPITPPVPERK